MNGNDQDNQILAEWIIGRFARHRTDAQNVELEAYAEEREAEAYSREMDPWRRPHPRLVDLLATADFMLDLINLMLRSLPPNSPEAVFLTNLHASMKTIRDNISAHIHGEPQRAAASK